MRIARTWVGIACSLGLMISGVGMASAVDQLVVDGDLADVDFSGSGQGDEALALGAVCPDTVTPAVGSVANVKLGISNSGGGFETNSFANGAVLTFEVVSVALTNDAVGGGKGTISAAMAPSPGDTVILPSDWQSKANNVKSGAATSTVTLTVPPGATPGGTLTADVSYRVSGSGRTGGSDASPNLGTVTRNKALQVSWSVKAAVDCATNSAPVLTLPGDYQVEATGPLGAVVTYSGVSALDDEDGDLTGQVSCDPPSGSQLALGAHTVECSVTDAGGLMDSGSFVVTVADTTDPSIQFVSRTAANGAGWNNGDVTVTWSCNDAVGVVASTVSTTISTEGENQSAEGTCTDTSGNTASDSVSGINIDKTAPTISHQGNSPIANANGWNNTDVTVTWTCEDALSGPVAASDSEVLAAEGQNQSATGSCSDLAGNTASDTQSGIDIDKTAPSLAPTVSPNPVVLNGTATASANASDTLSGIDSQSCDAVDTSSVGPHSVSCTATDNAGNTASASASYSVIFNWTGFFQPIDNLPTLNVVKAGSAVPVKFSLGGNQGLAIMAAGYPTSYTAACDAAAGDDAVEATVTAGSSSLSYDATTDRYNYAWKTDKAWAGSCRQLRVKLADGTVHQANFKLTK